MLKSGTPQDIRSMFDNMGRERKRLVKSVIQLVYFMRGSVQYDHMMNMSLIEREMISEFIENRLEVEGKKMYPVY
jgi:hypothetical protein